MGRIAQEVHPLLPMAGREGGRESREEREDVLVLRMCSSMGWLFLLGVCSERVERNHAMREIVGSIKGWRLETAHAFEDNAKRSGRGGLWCSTGMFYIQLV